VTSTLLAAPAPVQPIGRSEKLERTYLHPGQLVAVRSPRSLTTILGSCVGVCLHDPTIKAGGLNHYLLPRARAGDGSTRFGDVAIHKLLREVERLGGDRSRLVAKIFGGACVLDVWGEKTRTLGRANVEAAHETLHELGIRVIAEDTGGVRGRRVFFEPHTGETMVRTL
jgi:chemotaxis protein CheD